MPPERLQVVKSDSPRKEVLGVRANSVAMIRPPAGLTEATMYELYAKLLAARILPVIQPSIENDPREENRYFPTDNFREIGTTIYTSSDGGLRDLRLALGADEDTKPFLQRLKGRDKKAGEHFVGGYFVYNEQLKILFYSSNQVFPDTTGQPPEAIKYDKAQAKKTREGPFAALQQDGWRLIPLNTEGEDAKLQGDPFRDSSLQDLDFLMSSPFEGRDGKFYAFVAQSFYPSLVNNPDVKSTGIQFLQIPDIEAVNGGCNIADLDHGRVLIIANRQQAPTVATALIDNGLAKATIIEAPENFLDGGGGPRCSISSVSV